MCTFGFVVFTLVLFSLISFNKFITGIASRREFERPIYSASVVDGANLVRSWISIQLEAQHKLGCIRGGSERYRDCRGRSCRSCRRSRNRRKPPNPSADRAYRLFLCQLFRECIELANTLRGSVTNLAHW